MAHPVTLLMAIHCHQPVGNFGFVFEEAYANAYEPFLRVLERHPGVRVALHYSGCLLDWLLERRPDFVARVQALLDRGQVELLASGYYEPILPLLPEADRQGQIAKMRAALKAHCRAESGGLWLTERVWEPDLPATLARAGIRYTMVDTNQFAAARPWLPGALQLQDERFWDLLGCYTTDHAGSSVVVFPASKRLRYWMPFARVEQTVEFLKRLRRDEPVAITFADDGEKFGMWPKTHHWVYEEGWLDQFFAALERERDWLATATFHDYLVEAGPSGQVSLPCGSYEEMLEWSGGYFRNFFTKYPEANAMHHKMLRVSQRLADLKTELLKAEGSRLKAPRSARGSRLEARGNSTGLQPRATLLRQAEEELYAGQCNCAYWHGVFGGLYLAHLRRAVYAHLIAADTLIDRAMGHVPSVSVLGADGDQREEVSLKSASMEVLVDAAEGGTITEWILSNARINLLDTLSRRPEPYHDKLKAKPLHAAVAAAEAPASIHDTLGVKEQNLGAHLVYDDHRRSGFLDYALQTMPTLQEVVRSTWSERRLWSSGPFHLVREGGSRRGAAPPRVTMARELPGGRIRKTVRLDRRRPAVECVYELEGLRVPVVALEFNLSLRDERYLASAAQSSGVTDCVIEEPAIGVSLRLTAEPAATLIRFPVETVSESEEGLERTYQGLCLVWLWEVTADRWESRVRCELST